MSELLKFEGNIVDLDNLFNPLSYVEVRDARTNHLLGYVTFPRHILSNPRVRIPLSKTSHYGVRFAYEDNFPIHCNAEYREFQVRTAFDYKGQSLFKYLEADFNDWKDIVKDKKDSFATEYISYNGVRYIKLSNN
jgi:hypothetical protein